MDTKFKITGNVSLYAGDFTQEEFNNFSESEKLSYLKDQGKNLVVDTGLEQILALMLGNNTKSFVKCGVGSGNTAPANTDLALETAIGTNNINSRYRVGLVGYFNTFFGRNDNNGSWDETGLFTTDDIMLCRRVFSSTFTKDTSNSSVISWSLTIAAVAD